MLSSNNQIKEYVKENISGELITIPILKKIYEIIKDQNLSVESSSIIEYFKG